MYLMTGCEYDVHKGFRLPASLAEMIGELARENDRTESAQIRHMLKTFLALDAAQHSASRALLVSSQC
jgi:hypothetical protein